MPRGISNKTGVNWNKGKKRSPEAIKKMVEKNTGQKRTLETRKNISESHKGVKNPMWKGGTTPTYKVIRDSLEYRLWRTAVFERDKYICVWCGHKGEVQADHIKPFALFPELRFAIDNGRTLCIPCHKTTDTFGFRTKT